MTTLPTTPTRERTEELASERWPDLRVSEVESMRADANLFKHYWLNVQAFAHRTGAKTITKSGRQLLKHLDNAT